MNCEDCHENLTSLLFGELEEEKSLALHEHLASCDSCRDAYIELVETQGELEFSLNDKSISGLTADQRESILSNTDRHSAILKFPPWIFALAACLVIGSVIFINWKAGKITMAKNEQAASDRMEQEPQRKRSAKPEEVQLFSKLKDQAEEINLDSAVAAAPEKKEAREMIKKANNAESIVTENLLADKVVEKDKKFEAGAEKQAKPAVSTDSALFSVASLKIMVNTLLEKGNINTEEKHLLNELKSTPDTKIQLVFSADKNDAKAAEEKILIRILNNDKTAIDYAHIYIHNQNIIRVERVKKK